MAHIRKKITLGFVRGLGRLFGLMQIRFCLLSFYDFLPQLLIHKRELLGALQDAFFQRFTLLANFDGHTIESSRQLTNFAVGVDWQALECRAPIDREST